MDLSIEPFENGPVDSFQVLPAPVDIEHPGNCIHEALVPFEHFKWAGNAVHRKEDSARATGGCVREREALPMGKLSGPGDPQRIKCSATDGNGIRRSNFVESQNFGNAG